MTLFLTKEDVIQIHRIALEKYGGQDGFRDENLLDSALAQPQATFFGEFLHTDLFHMAAAYLFHISQNQAFIDGNKRTALGATRAFLFLNGYTLEPDEGELAEFVIALAAGTRTKDDATEFIRQNSREIEPEME